MRRLKPLLRTAMPAYAGKCESAQADFAIGCGGFNRPIAVAITNTALCSVQCGASVDQPTI